MGKRFYPPPPPAHTLIQKHSRKQIFICYALHDETGYTSKYIAASMRSIADNTASNLIFLILHTNFLHKTTKTKFMELAKTINSDINFIGLNLNDEYYNTDRRKFAEKIYPLFLQNYQPKENEKIIFMLSPQIVDKDIIEILKENNLYDKKGILPLFKKQYKNKDFGEIADENFIRNLANTPFNDGNMILRIIKQFKVKENEKIYSLRAIYNAMLKARHRVFFITEKRYKNYIEEHLFNKETDKIFFAEGDQINFQEFINLIQSLGEKTFVLLFSAIAFQVGLNLKKFGKIDGVDFIDAREIFTEEEGGLPKTNLNLLFRDI